MLSGPRLKGIEKMVMCWSSVRITSSEAMAGDDREARRVGESVRLRERCGQSPVTCVSARTLRERLQSEIEVNHVNDAVDAGVGVDRPSATAR